MNEGAFEDLSLGPATVSLLTRYGFDRQTFDTLRSKLAADLAGGSPYDAGNKLRGTVEPPAAGDVRQLPELGSSARRELAARGEQAIRAGKIAAVVLAGGMATRFGGVVKAAVEVSRGKTFLDLKLADIRASAARAQGRVGTYLMTSFATDADVTRMARAVSTAESPVETFSQFISLRLERDGGLFRDSKGEVSPYAPGHGDLAFALRRSGTLTRLREQGVTQIYVSNVDNLAATLDPAIIGAHLDSGKPITVEVADKAKGDKGGAPARVDGTLQIVEGFRFPAEFDQDQIPVFNTNTLIFDVEAIDRDFPLSWFAVTKEVEGKKVVQFERLCHELTKFLPTQMLGVSREGADGRFMPVKDPPELVTRRPSIESLLEQRGAL
ncbi:MAG TPA: UTP--glucose-1-phosphate uridylyltransferase [Polyangiales bacterium]|nr:UTP--glucose-1-phosphate uridylyltransferase [Polyangiales bacterium]